MAFAFGQQLIAGIPGLGSVLPWALVVGTGDSGTSVTGAVITGQPIPGGGIKKMLLELGRTMMVDAKIVFLDEVGAGVNRTLLNTIADATAGQVCDRRNLERIHRSTLALLRKEVEPVSIYAYADFLARWQHLHPAERLAGPGALVRLVGGGWGISVFNSLDELDQRVEDARRIAEQHFHRHIDRPVAKLTILDNQLPVIR